MARGRRPGVNARTGRGPLEPARYGQRLGGLIPVVVWLVLSVRMLLFTQEYAATIFVQDQWDFLSGFFDAESSFEQFRHQHGPHRQGLGGWLLAPVLAASGWDGVAIAHATASCIVLAALVALLLKRRLFGPLDAWDTAIPVLLLGLGQFQTIVGIPNPAHSALPLLLVMLCGWTLTLRNLRVRLATLLLLDLLAVHTGFGLFLGVVIPGGLALELARNRGGVAERRALAAALVVAVGVMGSFFLGWGVAKATSDCQVGGVLGAAAAWGLPFGRVVGSGHGPWGRLLAALLLLGVASVATAAVLRAWRSEERASDALVVALLAGVSLLFVATVVAGRACMGEQALYASRYSTLAASGLLAIFLASRWAPRIRGRLLVPALLCLAAIAAEARPKPTDARAVETTLRRRVAFSVCLVDRGDSRGCARKLGWPPHPHPERTRLEEKLKELRRTGRNVFSDRARSRVELRAIR